MLLCMVGGTAFAGWTVVNLHPAGATSSRAVGVSGGEQVGYAIFNYSAPHAGLWTGTKESWVDLNPAGSSNSYAYGVSGGQHRDLLATQGETVSPDYSCHFDQREKSSC